MNEIRNAITENRNFSKLNQTISDEEITDKINEAGVPTKIKGYRYIADAVSMVREDGRLIYAVVDKLYPKIAEKNNTSASSVERDIRYAVNKANDVIREKLRNSSEYSEAEICEMEKDKMTNKKFIAEVAGIRI